MKGQQSYAKPSRRVKCVSLCLVMYVGGSIIYGILQYILWTVPCALYLALIHSVFAASIEVQWFLSRRFYFQLLPGRRFLTIDCHVAFLTEYRQMDAAIL